MVAYSFKKQFAAKVESGEKRQTIRAPRTRHARPGETVQLYTGMRTKACRKLAEAKCIAALPIRLNFVADAIEFGVLALRSGHDLNAFARLDGFDDWQGMREFFAVPVFEGVLIKWQQPEGVAAKSDDTREGEADRTQKDANP